MADITFKVVDNKKWENLVPPTTAKKEDKYTLIMDALEAGEILEIPTSDNKEAKSLRISIARKASARGFRVEYRAEDNTLYVKKSTEPVETKQPKEKKKKETATV